MPGIKRENGQGVIERGDQVALQALRTRAVAAASAAPEDPADEASAIAASRRRWWVLVVLAAAASLAYLDLFSVNVALPSMSSSFGHASLSSLSWVLNAYAIVFAVLLVPMGRLADHFGRKRLLLSGVAIFVLGSVLSAAAPSLVIMIIGRVVQAAGAAIFLPASLGLLYPSFPEREHSKVVGIWAGVGAVAASSGPSLGGVLVNVSWRLIFLVNVVLGVAAIIGGLRVLPEIREKKGARLPDPLSVITLVVALALVTFTVVESATWGWGSDRIIVLLCVAILAVAVTVWRSITNPRALIEASLFRNGEYTTAAIGLFAFSLGLAVFLLGNVLFFEDEWHWSVIKTGVAIVPGPLGAAIFAMFAGRIIKRFGKSIPAIAGAVLFAAGAASWLVTATAHPDYWTGFAPALFVTGVGGGLIQPPLYQAASALPEDRATTGSAVLNMASQVGSALGIAILVTLLAAGHGLSGYQHGWIVIVISMGTAAVASAVYAVAKRSTRDDESPGLCVVQPYGHFGWAHRLRLT